MKIVKNGVINKYLFAYAIIHTTMYTNANKAI